MDSRNIALLVVWMVASGANSSTTTIIGGSRIHNFAARIAGGSEVTQGELPYQLSLRSNDRHICGASLIVLLNLQLAITAAHCLQYWGSRNYSLVAGDISLEDTTGFEQTRRVVSIVVHEEYNQPKFTNDLALLFMDFAFDLDKNVKPIGLPEESADVFGLATVSGWGEMYDGGDLSDKLLAVNLTVIDQGVCKEIWQRNPDPVELGDGVFCLTSLNGSYAAPCNYDSGGPAVSINYRENQHLVGVVSFSDDYCLTDYPAVFTNISKYVRWVKENIVRHATDTP